MIIIASAKGGDHVTSGVSLIRNAFHPCLCDIKARDEWMAPLTAGSHKAPFSPQSRLEQQ